MKDLIFPVKKVPVDGLLNTELAQASGITHAIITREKKIQAFVSEDYALITNEEIVQKFSDALTDRGLDHTMTFSAFRDARFRIDFYIPDFEKEITKGDKIGPRLFVNNSYNQTLKYGFGAGVMRLICTNGLTALVEEQMLNMLHTPAADEGLAIMKSIDMLESFMEKQEEIMEPFEELRGFKVRDLDRRLLEVTQATDFPVFLRELAKQTAVSEMKKFNVPLTDWLVYNALNFTLNHHASNLLGRKADRLDKEVLQYLLNY